MKTTSSKPTKAKPSGKPAPSSLPYFVHTMPGLEKIAWMELRQRLNKPTFNEFLFAKEKNGIVLFEHDGKMAELLSLRTTEDVFLVAVTADKLSRDWGDLRLVANLIEQSSTFGRAAERLLNFRKLSGKVTFRVVSRKEGDHQYRRMDFEEAVVKGIERRFGHRWEFVEENADVEVWGNILGSRLLCGLRLSDREMRHRDYKLVHSPASLRPSVAAALVLLTNPQPADVFIDPMCGNGTILAERIMHSEYRLLAGGDIALDRVNASRQNMRAFNSRVSLSRWDAAKLPFAAASIDKIATNPPFGKKIGSLQDVLQLYPALIAEIDRVLKPQGIAVIVTSEFELVKDIVRRYPKLQLTTGHSVAILGQWGRIYVLTKLA